MQDLGYYNGEYGPLHDMKIPFNDRVCFFGDGIYEATGYEHGRIFHLEAHLQRFAASAEFMRLDLPCSPEELAELLYEMAAKVEGEPLQIYWQLTRGTVPRSHPFPTGVPANLWIMIRPTQYPDLSKRIKLTAVEDTRYLHCNIKTLNLIPNVMASQKAAEEGCAECVFHRGEIVTECSHSNISILKDGVFRTHPDNNYILPGVAKARLIQACLSLGIPVEERAFTLAELRQADEVIVSSSTKFCLLADTFCGAPVGGRDTATAQRLQDWVLDELGISVRRLSQLA